LHRTRDIVAILTARVTLDGALNQNALTPIGNWQLATGNWQLATGNWQLATRH
jgi:hypothetical protein